MLTVLTRATVFVLAAVTLGQAAEPALKAGVFDPPRPAPDFAVAARLGLTREVVEAVVRPAAGPPGPAPG